MIRFTQNTRPSVNRVKQAIVNLLHNGIRIVIIVAEERGLIPESQAQSLFTLPVLITRINQLIERNHFFLKHMLLDGAQAIGNGSNTRALNIIGIVTRPAVVIILTVLNAIADDNRQKGCRHGDGIARAKVVIHLDLCGDGIIKLLFKCGIEIFKTLEILGVPRLNADLLACQSIDTIVESQFEHF